MLKSNRIGWGKLYYDGEIQTDIGGALKSVISRLDWLDFKDIY